MLSETLAWFVFIKTFPGIVRCLSVESSQDRMFEILDTWSQTANMWECWEECTAAKEMTPTEIWVESHNRDAYWLWSHFRSEPRQKDQCLGFFDFVAIKNRAKWSLCSFLYLL